ncbi:MAG: PPC domain-containing protein [Planctomycetota bacterium]
MFHSLALCAFFIAASATPAASCTHDCTQVDLFEDNESCAGAAELADGMFTELTVNPADEDFYSLEVPAGATLSVDAFFPHVDGNIDIYLWDPLLSGCPDVSASAALASGQSQTDNEAVTYTNVSAVSRTVYLQVVLLEASGCHEYSLLVDGLMPGDPGTLGESYCSAAFNSTGVTSRIYANGSPSIAANTVRLTADRLPDQATVLFLTSLTEGFVVNPGGSSGNLCVGGAIGRYVGPDQIQNSGPAGGSVLLDLDLLSIPTPTGTVTVLPGERRAFQAWHRDVDAMGMPTSNFTNGVRIDFVP